MLNLINTMTMTPPIAPVGAEYMAQASIQTDVTVDIVDLCRVKDRPEALSDFFSTCSADLTEISVHHVDDSFCHRLFKLRA